MQTPAPKQKRTPEFKLRAAAEAVAGESTMARLSVKRRVQPNDVSRWRMQLTDSCEDVFSKGCDRKEYEKLLEACQELQEAVHRQAVMLGRHRNKLEDWTLPAARPPLRPPQAIPRHSSRGRLQNMLPPCPGLSAFTARPPEAALAAGSRSPSSIPCTAPPLATAPQPQPVMPLGLSAAAWPG
jgi:transposase-like protein